MIKRLQLRNTSKFALLNQEDYYKVKIAKWYLFKSGNKEYAYAQIRLKDGEILKPLTNSEIARIKRPKIGNRFLPINIFPEDQKKFQVFLHRFLMNAPKGMEVDHINGEGLDNRRENLRICTRAENARNRQLSKNNRSGFSGVSYANSENRNKRWVASIRIGNGKRLTLGRFYTIEEAILVRKQAEKKYFGSFAR